MTTPRPRALLLDAMGTLIGLRHSVGAIYAGHAHRHGIAASAEAIDRCFRDVMRQAPPLAFPGLEGEALREAEIAWWGARIDTALLAAGATAPPPEALHRDLFDAFADPSLWRVYDDVPHALKTWHEAGMALAVVSNFDSRLSGLLEGLGLLAWLRAVVVSSSAGAAKPSARPFQLALEALGVCPRQAWHVGDSPEDSEGARAAGLRCLIVRRP
jgi:putative hydrolase of the HAD superfamily